MVAAQRELFAADPGIDARTRYEGVGEGGDRSLVIDREAEEIVFAELERLHRAGAEFTAISEERGEVVFGDGAAPDRVVIDPIDGSLNARRTMPSFAFSVAVASGPTMADVELGLRPRLRHRRGVLRRTRRQGALLDGAALLARGPGYGLELVGLEAAKPELILPLVSRAAGQGVSDPRDRVDRDHHLLRGRGAPRRHDRRQRRVARSMSRRRS